MGTTRDYLLDTGILILYARASTAGEAIEDRFHFRASPFKPMVSVVTLGEARAFARYRKWGDKKLAQLDGIFGNVVPIDISSPEVLEAYAEIHVAATSKGWGLGDNDKWIAATTKATGATLLTTDKDFDPLHEEFISRVYIDPHTGAAE